MMSELKRLLERESGKHSFQIELSDIRRFDAVSVDESGVKTVTARVGADDASAPCSESCAPNQRWIAVSK